MSDNRTTELIKDYAFALRRLEYEADKPGSNMTLGEYEAEEKKVTDEYSQAIAATFGSEKLTAEQVEEAVYRNCKFYEGGEVDVESITDELNAALGSEDTSRYDELFGTPERAARTLTHVCQFTHGGELCDRCRLYVFNECDGTLRLMSEQKIYDALLEWLRGEGEGE